MAAHSHAIEALRARLGERLQTGASVREQHGRDAAHHPTAAPDAVAFPETSQEVAAVLGVCAAHRCPVIAYGVGSSLEGHVTAPTGGVALSTVRMNRVIAVHADDLDAVVQPGVTRKALEVELRASGLMFPVDPGADASLGGMAATRASGTNAVRYGTMREAVLALEVALADGTLIRTGSRARKSSTGYDLTKLFVGSEGTLGVITELTLRLHGRPEAIAAATCAYPTVEGAVASVIAAIQSGIPVARLELLDAVQIRACNLYSGLGLPETPHLFVELHGTEAGVAEQAARFRDIAADNGAQGFSVARDADDRAKLWQARHDAYWAAKALRPGAVGYVTDACVPISALAQAVTETADDLAASRLIAPLVGHVGDGNFHLQILIDPDSRDELAEAERIAERIAERALRLGGTVSGEHGVGLGKKKHLAAEHGPALEVMRALKRTLDPLGILNPGKMLDMN